MKIGVLSDTHDRLPTIRRAVSLFRRLEVDAIIHAGDYVAPFAAKLLTPDELGGIPLHGIFGNNDGERKGLQAVLPQLVDGPIRLKLAGKTVAVAHYLEWFKREDMSAADVLISGHNHQPGITEQNGKLLLNPGECCGWLTDRCTVALLDLAGDKPTAELIDIRG